jgi:hypothetical protein
MTGTALVWKAKAQALESQLAEVLKRERSAAEVSLIHTIMCV